MERDAITAVIEAYLAGAAGDPAMLGSALHPEFRTAGQYEGREVWMTRADAIAAAGSGGAMPDWTLVALDVVGDTAVAQVSSPWQGRQFREILTLLRRDGRWQIAFKAFDIG